MVEGIYRQEAEKFTSDYRLLKAIGASATAPVDTGRQSHRCGMDRSKMFTRMKKGIARSAVWSMDTEKFTVASSP